MIKNNYKIKEISQLYGIGVDSLRYYEKLGLLIPRRDKNGYRLYSLHDIYKLNIIRDLRELDFTMDQIREYLDKQSIETTLELLYQEQELIRDRTAKLESRQNILKNRIDVITAAMNIETGVFSIKTLPNRPCLKFDERITRDEEMDYAIKMLHRIHNAYITDLSNQLYGASISLHEVSQGIKGVFHSVFFIFDSECTDTLDFDYFLPAGDYLSLHYRGSYEQSYEKVMEVVKYAKENDLSLLGDPFEVYEIDNRDTMMSDQYLTEIQVRVEQRK
ncbi:MerR family transcriptional regulator [Paenibacillus sp. FSL H8-0079]|uniref:MerR family transcriptional regulator n=1 Tax=Paenibacillus sp. FSL H8-0079 TaxID=2921375 RepID=UPI0030ECEDFD